jgi:hypothetical protein
LFLLVVILQRAVGDTGYPIDHLEKEGIEMAGSAYQTYIIDTQFAILNFAWLFIFHSFWKVI